MKLLGFLICLPLINGQNVGKKPVDEKIFHGKTVPIENAPYQASIENKDGVFCGACIIGDTWLVSAGHCLVNQTKENIWVRVGTAIMATGGTTVNITKIIVHPDFNGYTLENDISLMQTAAMGSNAIQKSIRVVPSTFPYAEGALVTITGWGITINNGVRSHDLQSATLVVVSGWSCAQAYGLKALYASMFCATANVAATCSGDSGGPAVIDKKLAGIISASAGCQTSTKPNILNRISNFYFWIENNTGLML